jgi:hypothetical protein
VDRAFHDMMLSTLGLAVALTLAPVQANDAARPITRHIEGTSFVAADSADRRFEQAAARDTLHNGARVGAIVGGVIAGAAVAYFCGAFRDDGGPCWPPVVLWSAIGAGTGALVGAGVDALFERRAAVGWSVRF